MTQLRRQMLEELERRHYSANTVRAYVRTVEDLARYFKRRPDRLGPEHIRQYQAHLFRDRKLAANTVAQRVAALRFFYIKTLGQEWNLDRAPYPKRPRRLPNILSPQEVARLIEAADSAFHRMIVMTLYATGVRRLELTQLQIHDIDSARMVVHVRDGKGGKDRKVLSAIAHCRTAALGGHRLRCDDCDHEPPLVYNSCLDRHCPKCQANTRKRWLEARRGELLPVRICTSSSRCPESSRSWPYRTRVRSTRYC